MPRMLFSFSKDRAITTDTALVRSSKKDATDQFTRLVLFYRGFEMTFHRIPGSVTSIAESGDGFLCLTEISDKKKDRVQHVLYHLDRNLHELSNEVVFEASPWYTNVYSTVDAQYIYVMQSCGFASIDMEDGLSFDVPTDFEFTRISLSGGEKVEWTLKDIDGNIVDDGFVVAFERMYMANGKPTLTCSVFDPDNLPVWDDPEVAPDPSDSDYATANAFLEEVSIDFGAKTLKSEGCI